MLGHLHWFIKGSRVPALCQTSCGRWRDRASPEQWASSPHGSLWGCWLCEPNCRQEPALQMHQSPEDIPSPPPGERTLIPKGSDHLLGKKPGLHRSRQRKLLWAVGSLRHQSSVAGFSVPILQPLTVSPFYRNNFIYLFLVLLDLHRCAFLVAVGIGHTSYSAWASPCGGFFRCGAQALGV